LGTKLALLKAIEAFALKFVPKLENADQHLFVPEKKGLF
jgi:hypothetical protein